MNNHNRMANADQSEIPYEELLQKYNHLYLAHEFQQKLIAMVINGSTLDQIIKEVFNLTQFPGVIHNTNGHPIISVGIESLSKGLTAKVLFQYITSQSNYPGSVAVNTIERNKNHFLLISKPFYIHEKRVGYCSILLKEQDETVVEFAQLMIEKVASVCSLCFFYEKTKLDSSEQMKSFFLKDIINGQFHSEGEMIAKAGLFQFDLSHPYYICYLVYHFNSKDFQNELVFGREIIESIKYFFSQHDKQLLINHDEHHMNIFVNDHFQNKEEKQHFFHSLMTSLTSYFPGSDFYLGISKRTQSILGAKHAYKQAIGAIRMITSKTKVIYYDSLGVIGALLNEKNEEEVRNMAKSLLGHLELDCQKSIELITTLYSFLINGGNLEKTAEELSLSISGLRYRVHKIEEILQTDIRNPVVSCQLLLAIQGLILLGDLGINNILDR